MGKADSGHVLHKVITLNTMQSVKDIRILHKNQQNIKRKKIFLQIKNQQMYFYEIINGI